MLPSDMLVLLVLIVTRAAGEWVEILQQRADSSRRASISFDETTKSNKIYANYSLAEVPRHRNVPSRNPIVGSVQRVEIRGKKNEIFSTRMSSENGEFESMGPVRAPNIKIRDHIETDEAKSKPNMDSFEKVYTTNINYQYRPSQGDVKTKKLYPKRSNFSNENIQIIKKNNFHEIITGNEDNSGETSYKTLEISPNINHGLSDSDSGISEVVHPNEDTRVNVEQYWKVSENKIKNNPGVTNKQSDETYNSANKILFENQIPPLQTPYSTTSIIKHIFRHSWNNDTDSRIKKHNATQIRSRQPGMKDKSNDYTDRDQAGREEVNLTDNTKTNTIEVMWKLMKVVTDNISRNTKRSFRSKIRYLEGVRNIILANIAERVEQAWPDDANVETWADARGTRRRRGAHGHVEFPSSESALMTISFLTFAVFLIKLVLQVIHTYKNKTMMVAPTVVAAVGRAAASLREHTRP